MYTHPHELLGRWRASTARADNCDAGTGDQTLSRLPECQDLSAERGLNRSCERVAAGAPDRSAEHDDLVDINRTTSPREPHAAADAIRVEQEARGRSLGTNELAKRREDARLAEIVGE